MAGISRSATLVIAYLMQYYGLPMQQAYQFVKDKRPTSSPNLNFMGQLVEFDRIIKEHKLTQFLDISAYIPTVELEIRSTCDTPGPQEPYGEGGSRRRDFVKYIRNVSQLLLEMEVDPTQSSSSW
eukprot:Em0007g840a